MRNYTNTLLFESALDSVQPSNSLVYNAIYTLFNPRVKVVEDDCGTVLGVEADLHQDLIGSTEVDTGSVITFSRLVTLSSLGIYKVRTRSLSSCIANGGVCKTCLLSSRPRLTSVIVDSTVQITPELLISSNSQDLDIGATVISLPYATNQYDKVYVYKSGTLVAESAYSISGSTLTFNTAITNADSYLLKFYVVSNVCYYYWLSKTYSGSLLGIKPLVEIALPIKVSLLRSLVNVSDISDIENALLSSDFAGEDFVQYAKDVSDPLEKAVLVLILGSIFLS
jgi:hypothetical protein